MPRRAAVGWLASTVVLGPLTPVRLAVRAVTLLVAALVAYLAVTAGQVLHAASEDQTAPAGAIVVLGAAQYDGRPSPDLAARLSQGLTLWQRHVAPVVVVTGGKQPTDTYTEAEVGASWLAAHGVPQAALLREVNGRDTYQSLDATAAFLRARGIRSVVLVSDAFHDERLALVSSSLGMHPEVSPATGSPIHGGASVSYYAKEIAEVATGRIIGWRHLNDLDQRLGLAGT